MHTDCLKLFENGRKKAESFPMFRTGVGKSVVIKQSSIEKALSVVADEDAFNSGIRSNCNFDTVWAAHLYINFSVLLITSIFNEVSHLGLSIWISPFSLSLQILLLPVTFSIQNV